LPATDGFVPCDLDEANALLVHWEHKLGECHRPFRTESWLFLVDGVPTAVAISASTVSATVAGYRRQEVVELARICASERWANRLMLRWWREVGARRWECWPVRAAVSYHLEAHHTGDLYRFDGWTKVKEGCGSRGGGTWSRERGDGDPSAGAKTLWLWTYEATP
jgi:hypothetical protein